MERGGGGVIGGSFASFVYKCKKYFKYGREYISIRNRVKNTLNSVREN
jgi:hypothetical protein